MTPHLEFQALFSSVLVSMYLFIMCTYYLGILLENLNEYKKNNSTRSEKLQYLIINNASINKISFLNTLQHAIKEDIQ